jgi:hypothetical protein
LKTHRLSEANMAKIVYRVAREPVVQDMLDQLPEGWHGPLLHGEHVHVGRDTSVIGPPGPRLQSNQFPLRTVYARPRAGDDFVLMIFEEPYADLAFPQRFALQDKFETVVAIYLPVGHVQWQATKATPHEICNAELPAEGELSIQFPGASDDDEVSDSGLPRLTRKEQKAIEKEVPWDRIPVDQRGAYVEARLKEWSDWQKWKAVRILTPEETAEVLSDPEQKKRVLSSRFCYRDKGAGQPPELYVFTPKARLVVQGFRDPDRHRLRKDSPTVNLLASACSAFCR